MKALSTFSSIIFCLSLNAQSPEEQAVIDVIENLFEGMRQGDSTMVSASFIKEANMYTVLSSQNGRTELRKGSLKKFLDAVGTPHQEIWDEPIWNTQVNVAGNLAQVWTDYAFYLGKEFSHCGVDAFQLVKKQEGWKIFQITDTRTTLGCDIPEHIQSARK